MPTGTIVADNYIDDPDRTVAEMQVAMNGLFDYVRSIKDELAVLSRQEFRECAVLDPMELMPPRTIMMWPDSIATIPSGWALCDGTNGTPDMRGLFPVGAGGTYSPLATGGADSVQLTESQMPSHNHAASASTAGSHNHLSGTGDNPTYNHIYGAVSYGGTSYNRASTRASGEQYYSQTAGSHSHSITVSSKGGGQSHENRPPYRALSFIMRLPWSAT